MDTLDIKPIATAHAYEKAKERLSWKPKILDRMIITVLENGISHTDTKGTLNRYITKLWYKHKTANNIRIYMEKDLKYFMSLNYPLELIKIAEEDGGGYSASIPMLGKYAFVGTGNTPEEAIDSLNSIKEYLFKDYILKNIPIIEPNIQNEDEKDYSGKFILRIPKELHRFLSIEANKNNTTLNQYCLYILTRKSFLKSIFDEITEVKKEIKYTTDSINKIDYNYKTPDLTLEKSKKAEIHSMMIIF